MTEAQQHKKQLQEKLRSLNEINRKLIGCQTLEEVTTEALKQVRYHLKVQVASIFLFNKDGYIQRVGIEGVDKDNNPIDGEKWLPDEKYLPGQSFSGKPVPPSDSESTYGEPHYSNQPMEEYVDMINGQTYRDKLGQLKSIMSVPLNGLNRTFGTLEVFNKKDNNRLIDFDNDDVYILMLFGTIISGMIADFRRRDKLSMYSRMAQMLIKLESKKSSFVLQDVYQFVVNNLVSSTTAYKVAIIRIANKNKEFEIAEQAKTEDIYWNYRKKILLK
ncbi:MAG: GAF domain-containing protein [Crocosphaera sp.]